MNNLQNTRPAFFLKDEKDKWFTIVLREFSYTLSMVISTKIHLVQNQSYSQSQTYSAHVIAIAFHTFVFKARFPDLIYFKIWSRQRWPFSLTKG